MTQLLLCLLADIHAELCNIIFFDKDTTQSCTFYQF